MHKFSEFYICGDESCSQRFTSVCTLRRHIKAKHALSQQKTIAGHIIDSHIIASTDNEDISSIEVPNTTLFFKRD